MWDEVMGAEEGRRRMLMVPREVVMRRVDMGW
jgi:hypothetical protein